MSLSHKTNTFPLGCGYEFAVRRKDREWSYRLNSLLQAAIG